ncbi:heme exporter protein CcmB [Caldinitratiruptor microaerophilus]|uniref:Heme ABC transporter permease n=1 Tax=Caldinitratiruptor microaerophilus TaxID=671077 RepID=A0AA35CKZ0_9FIRM|nr:heme exporter protein CcmB [Caldinitratiruptor microaerophilus]BDG61127.1 heme ABC transporter permease [Caldinitratiruptor microaerophilus]
MSLLRTALAICRKDLQTELRSREVVPVMVVFALIAGALWNFALDPAREALPQVFPGLLWLTVFFAGMLGVYRSFFGEVRGGTLAGLMLAPVDRAAIYYGKLFANAVLLLLLEAVAVPAYFLFFDYRPAGRPLALVPVLLLGTVGFAATGTLLAALAAATRAGEALLPVLLFPVLVPLVLGVVQVTRGVLDPGAVQDAGLWLRLLVAYDAAALALPYVLFESLVEV